MKKILFVLVLLISQMYFLQILSFKDVYVKVPKNYKGIEQQQLNIGKISAKSDSAYSKVIKMFEETNISWNKTFYFKNSKCNCINTLQIGSENYYDNLKNSDLSLQNKNNANLIYTLKQILNQNIDKLKQANVSAKINIEPKIIRNTNNVNIIYNQIEYEMKKPSTNVLTKYVTDTFILIQNDLILESIFNSEENNYRELANQIDNYKNSMEIK